MKRATVLIVVGLCGLITPGLSASGQAGIFGVIERVVFEPNAEAPERVQVWGAFTFVEHIRDRGFTGYAGPRSRGYLYFNLPADHTEAQNTRKEWADLNSVAGTKQAVSFGYWDRFRGDKIMTVRNASAKPADPDVYRTDIGLTKLSATGPHGWLVGELLKLTER